MAVNAAAQTADSVSGCEGAAPERTINANPANYRSLLGGLLPGDRLLLAAGTYTQGLPLSSLAGEPGRCITIEGPAAGPRAVFTGRSCCNTVALIDVRYVAIRHLDLLGQNLFVDAVKAESPAVSVHHILLDDLAIDGHDVDQSVVGISTKCPAWNWAIRRCRIVGAGTGLYLGNSDGSAPFVGGLIEHNLVRDTIGYNMQIKHQLSRDTSIGTPSAATTIIRHNVFSKAQNASTGDDARPNVLVGHWPLTGDGMSDVYQIYGNFFHQNPVEALFQGEGHIGFYANVLVNDFNTGFPAVAIQPHNDVPKRIAVFHNTVVSRGTIDVSGGDPMYRQRVVANAVFSDAPPSGGQQSANVADVYSQAPSYVSDPWGPVGGGLDVFPLPGALTGALAPTSGLTGFVEWDRDFNGNAFDLAYRGAYSGAGANPGWMLALDLKPTPAGGPTPTPTATATPTNTVPPSATPTATATSTATPTSTPGTTPTATPNTGIAQITSPVPGTTLAGATVTFSWTPGTGVGNYKLKIGSTPGGNDVFVKTTTALSWTVTTLPTDGRTLFVSMESWKQSLWRVNAYTYTAAAAP